MFIFLLKIMLWEEGSTKSVEDMKKMGQYSKFVFKDLISDTLAEAYTFHNLKAATIYKAQISLVFKSA